MYTPASEKGDTVISKMEKKEDIDKWFVTKK